MTDRHPDDIKAIEQLTTENARLEIELQQTVAELGETRLEVLALRRQIAGVGKSPEMAAFDAQRERAIQNGPPTS